MTDYIIGRTGDFTEGEPITIEAGRRTIAVYRLENEFYAIANACPHKGASLCEGKVLVKEKIVRCPWHHWNWEIPQGKLEADGRQKLRTFNVVVEDDSVIVRI